jgi:hypothetical protein
MSILGSLMLAACGGGGGGGSDGGGDNAQTATTPLVLTAVNYESVSQSALEGTDGLSALSASSSSVFTAVELETAPAWMPALVSQVKKIKSWSVNNTAILSGVQTTVSDACTYGGSMNISFNDANNNDELDAGESMSISFSNCVVSNTERINGSMSFLVNSISDGYYSAVDFSMNLNNFSVVSGNTTSFATGDMRLRMQEYATYTNYSIGINSLTSSATVSGATKSYSMSGFSMTLKDAVTANDEQTYSGTLAMSRFNNQSVVISTTSPWLISNGASFPYSGQMILTGQSGSKIRISALSSSNARLEFDAAADGVYEESKVVTWASLQ